MTLRIVLLGASGFLGGAVLRQMKALDRPREAHCLAHRRPIPKHDFIQLCPGEVSTMPAGLLPPEPHVVVHCASKQVDTDGLGFASNLHGVDRLLAMANPFTRAIVYASSFSVYGDGPQAGVTEDTALQPHTALAKSRAECEARLLSGARVGGVPVAVLRARFVFGEGDCHFLPGLLRLARAGVKPGSGRQRFSVIDVDDYAKVILSLARRFLDEEPGSSTVPAVFNVGYRQPVSWQDIADILCEAAGCPPARIPVPVNRAVLRGLGALPLETTRRLVERLQLLGYDHYGDVSRLAATLPIPVLDRDPRQVIAAAVAAMPGVSTTVCSPRGF